MDPEVRYVCLENDLDIWGQYKHVISPKRGDTIILEGNNYKIEEIIFEFDRLYSMVTPHVTFILTKRA